MASVPGGGGFLANLSGLLSSPQASPNLGLAMGLLQASGAQRLPVTMGAALANGLAQSKAYQAQSLQNAMSQLMLGYKGGLLNAMGFGQPQGNGQPTGSDQSPQALQVPAATQAPQTQSAQAAPSQPNLLTGGGISIPGLSGTLIPPSSMNQALNSMPVSAMAPMAAAMGAAAAQTQQNQQNQNNQGAQRTAPPQSQQLFGNMPPDQRLAMDAALFTDPGRLAQAMYENNPQVKAQESDLNQDLMMARAAPNAAQRQLWVNKAYQDSGAIQHTFGGVANILGMGPGGSIVFGKPPEGAIMRNGQVEIAPGAPQAVRLMEAQHAIGSAFGKDVPTVNSVTGATTGYLPAASAMGYGLPGVSPQASRTLPAQNQGAPAANGVPGPVFAIGPAQKAAQAEIAKQSTEQLTDAIDSQQQAQSQIAQLGELSANLGALNTSAAKPAKVAIENLLNGLGTTLGVRPFNVDLTNTQAAQKTIVNFTAQATRQLGSREAFQAMQFVEKGLPNIKNTPAANEVVTGMLRGLADYANARGAAAQKWQSQYGSGYAPGAGTFQGKWQQEADPFAFMMDALPQFEQQAIVQAASKNATLRAELQNAARSKALMVQQGYIGGQ